MNIRMVREQTRRAFSIAKKDLRIYYYKPPVLISGILMPIFLCMAFLMGNKSVSLPFLIAGLLSMTLFFTATAISPVIFPWEGQTRTLERLISCPVAPESIIMGDMIASTIFGIAITLVALFIGHLIGVIVIHWILLICAIIIGSICFSAIGMLLSVPPTAVSQNIMLLSTLVKFPLIFVSGIFMPVEQMPGAGQVIAYLSPLTYFTDIARFSLTGTGYFPIYFDVWMLLLFTIILSVASIVLHKKTMPLRI
ncbi:ABC transporter permease [Methanospirillum stamsii]|uniref:ABC transporter n=1 Tax=Methanospirillum stamsii TaxID=1277351 RepID=A0A2V2NHJ1_9EURY|nr:ABC transporter permease [Methanospirillum stamsii]PWR75848.1 ABC transporter [Methanospirillum stamsii]